MPTATVDRTTRESTFVVIAGDDLAKLLEELVEERKPQLARAV